MDAVKKPLRAATLVFVRQEKAVVSNLGVLELKTHLETDAEVKAALVAAITGWVNTTQEGQSLWGYSCADMNIGDLAGASAFEDEHLLAALKAHDVEFLSCLCTDCEDAISYDEVLVNEADINVEEELESQGEAQ